MTIRHKLIGFTLIALLAMFAVQGTVVALDSAGVRYDSLKTALDKWTGVTGKIANCDLSNGFTISHIYGCIGKVMIGVGTATEEALASNLQAKDAATLLSVLKTITRKDKSTYQAYQFDLDLVMQMVLFGGLPIGTRPTDK